MPGQAPIPRSWTLMLSREPEATPMVEGSRVPAVALAAEDRLTALPEAAVSRPREVAAHPGAAEPLVAVALVGRLAALAVASEAAVVLSAPEGLRAVAGLR